MNKRINSIIEKAKKDKHAIAVALFGSSVNGKGRDIDICIFLDKKYSNLEMSRKRLGYLDGDIDVQIFQQLPVYIRSDIIKKGKILFCKNTDLLYGFAFDTIKEFGFFKKLYDMYLEEVKNG